MITIACLTFGLLAQLPELRQEDEREWIPDRVAIRFRVLDFVDAWFPWSLYYGSSIKHDIMHGLADGTVIILLTIWGKTIRDSVRMKKQSRLFAFVVICLFHLCGRYFMYLVWASTRVDVKPLQFLFDSV